MFTVRGFFQSGRQRSFDADFSKNILVSGDIQECYILERKVRRDSRREIYAPIALRSGNRIHPDIPTL